MRLTRPILRWHGGKWILAEWIIGHFPPHKIYVEPFGGAASVLVRKPRSFGEVYNDLDDDVVALFRVLRDPEKAKRLAKEVALTPFSRREFEEAYQEPEDPVERARQLIVRAFMGFGSNAHASTTRSRTGFRANSWASHTVAPHDWANYPEHIKAIVERLTGVVIEHRDGVACMKQHDSEETLHYVDPPYLPDTRSPANKYDLKHRMYRHELSPGDHGDLLDALKALKGMVLLSGYPHSLYDDALPGWTRVERDALADGARPRIEVLWINPVAAARARAARAQAGLFDEALPG